MNNRNVIKKSNSLIEAKCNLTLNQQKLILTVIAMINKDDDDFKEYALTVIEFKKLLDLKTTGGYTEIRTAARTIKNKGLTIRIDEKRELLTSWFSDIELDQEGILKFSFSRKLKPYLLQLKSCFTTYQLKNILKLNSKYSVRLYELLKQYESIEVRKFSIEELKELLFISEDSYTRFSDFRKRVVEVAVDDINSNTDLSIDYELSRTGRVISHIEFFITDNNNSSSSPAVIPDEILKMVPKNERNNSKKLLYQIMKRDGVAGLRFYIEKVNSKQNVKSWGGLLKTLFDADLYADIRALQEEKVRLQEEQQNLLKSNLEQQKASQEDHQRKLKLIQSVDLEELDFYIGQQNLNQIEKNLLKKNKMNMLRLTYIERFLVINES